MKVKIGYMIKMKPSPRVTTEFDLEPEFYGGFSLRDRCSLGELVLQLTKVAKDGKVEVAIVSNDTKEV